MHCTQNEKIAQVSNESIVVGIDISSEKHCARAFTSRGIELTRKAFTFANTGEGFEEFERWLEDQMDNSRLTKAIIGFEPTGHYWFNLADYLDEQNVQYVLVAPQHVKHTKELDDNTQRKDDWKDPRVIAKLVIDGRYFFAYRPQGKYAELRESFTRRCEIMEQLIETKNRLNRWFDINFPEYKTVYRKVDASTGMMILRKAPLPKDIVTLGVDGVNQIWRNAKQKGTGIKRAQTLVKAAQSSIGAKETSQATRISLWQLLDVYEIAEKQLHEIDELISSILAEMPDAQKMLAIKGIGQFTVAGFLSEVGDIRRFTDPRQIQKYAGLAIVADNDSGKHEGRTKLSQRGRKRLRWVLFRAALSLVKSNPQFYQLHQYFTGRQENPLKKIQSIVAVSTKLIRVVFGMIKNDRPYDPEKMMSDIHRPMKIVA